MWHKFFQCGFFELRGADVCQGLHLKCIAILEREGTIFKSAGRPAVFKQ